MNKVTCAVVEQAGKIKVIQIQRPKIGSADAWLRTTMMCICSTDIEIYSRQKPFLQFDINYPFLLGHEFVGVIEEMGKQFPRRDMNGFPLREGDRVVVWSANLACGKCYYCKYLLQPNLCRGKRNKGHFLLNSRGGFSTYNYIPANSSIYKVPDNVPTEVVVLIEPISACLYALERSFFPGVPDRYQGMGPGRVVVIQGSGATGILLVILTRLSGASKIIVVGGSKIRLDLCKEYGADYVIDHNEMTESEDRIEAVRALTPYGEGADVVFETAGVPEAFLEGVEMIHRGGTFVSFGNVISKNSIKFDPSILAYQNINLVGSWGNNPNTFGTALRILEANCDKIPFQKLITHRFSLFDVKEAIEQAKKHREAIKVVLIPK